MSSCGVWCVGLFVGRAGCLHRIAWQLQCQSADSAPEACSGLAIARQCSSPHVHRAATGCATSPRRALWAPRPLLCPVSKRRFGAVHRLCTNVPALRATCWAPFFHMVVAAGEQRHCLAALWEHPAGIPEDVAEYLAAIQVGMAAAATRQPPCTQSFAACCHSFAVCCHRQFLCTHWSWVYGPPYSPSTTPSNPAGPHRGGAGLHRWLLHLWPHCGGGRHLAPRRQLRWAAVGGASRSLGRGVQAAGWQHHAAVHRQMLHNRRCSLRFNPLCSLPNAHSQTRRQAPPAVQRGAAAPQCGRAAMPLWWHASCPTWREPPCCAPARCARRAVVVAADVAWMGVQCCGC